MAANPLEMAVNGFTALYNNRADGLSVGGYSRSAPNIRRFAHDDPAVVSMTRARWVAREFHDWDIESESDLKLRRMRGELAE